MGQTETGGSIASFGAMSLQEEPIDAVELQYQLQQQQILQQQQQIQQQHNYLRQQLLMLQQSQLQEEQEQQQREVEENQRTQQALEGLQGDTLQRQESLGTRNRLGRPEVPQQRISANSIAALMIPDAATALIGDSSIMPKSPGIQMANNYSTDSLVAQIAAALEPTQPELRRTAALTSTAVAAASVSRSGTISSSTSASSRDRKAAGTAVAQIAPGANGDAIPPPPDRRPPPVPPDTQAGMRSTVTTTLAGSYRAATPVLSPPMTSSMLHTRSPSNDVVASTDASRDSVVGANVGNEAATNNTFSPPLLSSNLSKPRSASPWSARSDTLAKRTSLAVGPTVEAVWTASASVEAVWNVGIDSEAEPASPPAGAMPDTFMMGFKETETPTGGDDHTATGGAEAQQDSTGASASEQMTGAETTNASAAPEVPKVLIGDAGISSASNTDKGAGGKTAVSTVATDTHSATSRSVSPQTLDAGSQLEAGAQPVDAPSDAAAATGAQNPTLQSLGVGDYESISELMGTSDESDDDEEHSGDALAVIDDHDEGAEGASPTLQPHRGVPSRQSSRRNRRSVRQPYSKIRLRKRDSSMSVWSIDVPDQLPLPALPPPPMPPMPPSTQPSSSLYPEPTPLAPLPSPSFGPVMDAGDAKDIPAAWSVGPSQNIQAAEQQSDAAKHARMSHGKDQPSFAAAVASVVASLSAEETALLAQAATGG
ncbi:hypothetical protein THASP1DRAFT_33747 [Thamnocephalis sphaerospora]|uniref:Uncharacterized protein n=1 Tax=Thamnocephalis sphaerospora TaxID=78915 RepID=A0A4P9XFU8_9FUNG|nr:hypothetical protein THASP1DRAFT_33747 [Thamnocephalis sphaerospora]|eukprot:RKP04483.1 hypothetical protein THASP1DRAFT_33747 [Thamnocephalis sphaerospora]